MKLIFRMFLSSKFGKNNPLKYIRKGPKIVTDMEVFMASLIMNVDEKQDVIPMLSVKAEVKKEIAYRVHEISIEQMPSYPELRKLISNIIRPGSIRKVIYHENRNTGQPVLVFDVSGYKYCSNIGKNHQSNNIYFVANPIKRYVYQKCYKCLDFKGHHIEVQSGDGIIEQFDSKDNADLLLACANH